MNWTPSVPDPAHLVLADGRTYTGRAFGAPGYAMGEVCFNTSMTGYQEVLTDPSYAGQIVVMTAPQMGNYGLHVDDAESQRPHVAGFVVRSLSRPHAARDIVSLHAYLARHGIPGLFDVDTRALTRHLRGAGVQNGILARGPEPSGSEQDRLRAWGGLGVEDLVGRVTCAERVTLAPDPREEPASPGRGGAYAAAVPPLRAPGVRIVAYDLGVKRNIVHRLRVRGCEVTIVPASTPANRVLQLRPHGVLLSNGPGDPEAVQAVIAATRTLLERLPVFGICLGHQVLGLALGGKRYKLKFGHRGVNHPVRDVRTGKVRITSQNHGYAIDAESLPAADVEVTEWSLNDGSVEALAHRHLPVFSVQYHPEAAPGPHDNDAHFDVFVRHAARFAGVPVEARAAGPGGADAAA